MSDSHPSNRRSTSRRWVWGAGLAAALVVAIGTYFLVSGFIDVGPPSSEPDASPEAEGAPDAVQVASADGSIHWVVAGGGATPELNQVSIESDLKMASELFRGPGRLLYAGGRDSNSVQVLRESAHPDPLMEQLGELFDPRPGRAMQYRETRLAPDAPAKSPMLLEWLDDALRQPQDPALMVYIAAHGDMGQSAAENAVLLWAGSTLAPTDLAAAGDADGVTRPWVLVVTACYSGGFAEIAFRDGLSEQGATTADRCGLFASTWDQVSSGCDPNPDRRTHEGYGVHFLHALAGANKSGEPLEKERLDFDGDGTVSLLEAHARARIASVSVGIPTTTAERWLREVAPQTGPELDVVWPEETAVVAGLRERLEMSPGQAALALEGQLERERRNEQLVDSARQAEEESYFEAAGALLARWPVLDDPWHPDFSSTLEAGRSQIEAFLATSPLIARYRADVMNLDRANARLDGGELRRAPVERLARAEENLQLARRLKVKGGADWDRFQAFLKCERRPAETWLSGD